MSIEEAYARLLEEIGPGKHMVLSTAEDNRVSSRMMSVIQTDGQFYFQTDAAMKKYAQLKVNPRAALCVGSIQIEGMCEELGHPQDLPAFSAMYREVFPGSYDRYSMLENERVFRLTPTLIERWLYIEGEPYIETMDFAGKAYRLIPYMD